MIPTRPSPPPYKPTLMDRHGPEGAMYIKIAPYAVIVALLLVAVTFRAVPVETALWLALPVAVLGVLGTFGFALGLAHLAGRTYQHLMMDGTSTPYREQYSREQALVMRGRVDDALASFEAVIAEQPTAVLARLKAAELYASEKRNSVRAAALFREVLRIESASVGDVVYATNRLVDLLAGPLGEPGKAMVELRRFIDHHPDAPAASHAREALAALRARVHDTLDAQGDA